MNQGIIDVIFGSNFKVDDKKMIVEGLFVHYTDMNYCLNKLFLKLKFYLDKQYYTFTFDELAQFIKDLIMLSSNYNEFNRFVSTITTESFKISVALLNYRMYREIYGINFSWDNLDDENLDELVELIGFYNLKFLDLFNKEKNNIFKNSLLSLKNICRRKLIRMLFKCQLNNCLNNVYCIDIKRTLNLNKEIYFFIFNFLVIKKKNGLYVTKVKE